MKKLFLVCGMLIAAMSAKAQFTVYQPYNAPSSSSYTPSPGYGAPFTIYRPAPSVSYQEQYQQSYPQQYQQPRQSSKPRMQELTTKGYFKKSGEWYYVTIRIGVIGDEIKLLSTKSGSGWSNCGSMASAVGAYDSEEIRDNFTYKAYTYLYGTVYF